MPLRELDLLILFVAHQNGVRLVGCLWVPLQALLWVAFTSSSSDLLFLMPSFFTEAIATFTVKDILPPSCSSHLLRSQIILNVTKFIQKITNTLSSHFLRSETVLNITKFIQNITNTYDTESVSID